MGVKIELCFNTKLFLAITVCSLFVLAAYIQTDLLSGPSHFKNLSSQITILNPDSAKNLAQTNKHLDYSSSESTGKTMKQVYRPGFENAMPNLCSQNSTSVTLLIIITSSPENEYTRTAIRKTWGMFDRNGGVVVAFMVGVQNDPYISRQLIEENSQYQDIITNQNVDSYRNLTLKTMSIFEWTRTYCTNAAYILKTDDDVFINVPSLLKFLNSTPKDKGRDVIYGRLATAWTPNRDKTSKYYLSESEFSSDVYPEFTTGPAYLLTPDVASELYETGINLQFLSLEDVFFTGIVAQLVGVERVSEPRFTNDKPPRSLKSCEVLRVFAYHDVNAHQLSTMWKYITDKKIKMKCRSYWELISNYIKGIIR